MDTQPESRTRKEIMEDLCRRLDVELPELRSTIEGICRLLDIPLRTTEEYPQLLTTEEVCGILAISRAKLWRLRKRTAFPAPVRAQGTLRWRDDELIEWIDQLPREESVPFVPKRSGKPF